MKNVTCTLGTLIIVCLMTAGCAREETRVQKFWGTSYNLAKYNQTAENQMIELEAPEDNEPITDMDAAVTNKVMKTYINSFEGQEQESKTYTIDMGVGN